MLKSLSGLVIVLSIVWIVPAQADWFEDIESPVIWGGVEDITTCAAWGDFNNDGLEDLFVGNDYFNGGHCHIYKNNGNGDFEDVTFDAGVANENMTAWGCSWGDYDNDGYLDLYVSNMLS